MKHDRSHIKGTLHMRPTGAGGRSTGVKEGYRPTVNVGGTGGSLCIAHMDEHRLEPGQSATVEMEFLAPAHIKEALENVSSRLTRGDTLDIYKGRYRVGRLDIEEVSW